MSDGDGDFPDATPGLPSAGPNRWLTRSAPPSPGAAPWERSGLSDAEHDDKGAPAGKHTDGVTVADLIAKLNGASSVTEVRRGRRPAAELRPAPELPAPATEIIRPVI